MAIDAVASLAALANEASGEQQQFRVCECEALVLSATHQLRAEFCFSAHAWTMHEALCMVNRKRTNLCAIAGILSRWKTHPLVRGAGAAGWQGASCESGKAMAR